MTRSNSYRPDDVVKQIDDALYGLVKLRNEIRWVHSVAHGRNPAPTTDKVRVNGTSDPTGELVVNQERIRTHYRNAADFIQSTSNLVSSAQEETKKAIDAADRHEDLRLLPREYDVPRKEVPVIRKQEKTEAEEYQRRRHAAGRGFGES